MAAKLFSVESARIAGLKSVAARRARKEAAKKRQEVVASAVASNDTPDVEGMSRAAKRRLSEEIICQLDLLKTEPPTRVSQLANSPDGEGRASLAKRLTEMAAQLFGWDADKGNTLVMVGIMQRIDPDEVRPAIEIQDADVSK